jgi:hypothetical protein
MRPRLVPVFLALLILSCATETGRLSADQEQRLAAEGVTRRANNLVFRHTRGAGARWDDRRASIVVTRGTILIHRNGEIEFLLAPGSRRLCEVHRDHGRVRINAGSGQSAEVWSFEPPDDPEAWATDIRSTIRARKSPR